MKNIFLPLLLLAPVAAFPQDPVELTLEDGEYHLFLPYFELNNKAWSVEMSTPKESSALVFQVDLKTLVAVELEDEVVINETEGACTSTAKAAFLSCDAEVEEEFFIGFGNCLNTGSSASQVTCENTLSASESDGEDECDEQLKSRIQTCAALTEAPYNPNMNPGNFMTKAEIIANPNQYFPLRPGNEWVYESDDEIITVTVSASTKQILGITTIVVRDVVTDVDGVLIEDTDDWYAQDKSGNIWYMGEIARNYEDGKLTDVNGSWEAGVDGAKAGILIRGVPVINQTIRQEFLLGEAEDMSKTLSLSANAISGTPANVECKGNCLQTLEFTPIEPGHEEHKFYRPGIGKILIVKQSSGEREELVSYTLK